MKKSFYNEQLQKYTFSEFEDGIQNKSVIPPKYSPTDKYGAYRRKAKLVSE
jgi:rRNA maturation protein Nop10